MASPTVSIDRSRHWTVDEVLALPDDGNRYEVVDGVLLVGPSPRQRHQTVIRNLFRVLDQYLLSVGLGDTIFWQGDITYTNDTMVVPDLFIGVPEEITGDWRSMQHLRLAVEVLSPSSVKADRWIKRLAYQKYGVATYWVVDAEAGNVKVWHPGDAEPEIVTEHLEWRVTPDSPPLTIDLATLFAERGATAPPTPPSRPT